MSTAPPAPPVTEDEVTAMFLAYEYVLSATDVATHVWWMRGGTGEPAEYRRNAWDPARRPAVPLISRENVQKALDRMVTVGTLVVRTGQAAVELGATYRTPQPNARYYALAEQAKKSAERDREQVERRRRIEVGAARLSALAVGRVLGIDVEPDGTLLIRADLDQARALLDIPPNP